MSTDDLAERMAAMRARMAVTQRVIDAAKAIPEVPTDDLLTPGHVSLACIDGDVPGVDCACGTVATPEEARRYLDTMEMAAADCEEWASALAQRVVTEPDRTRTAVVAALRNYGNEQHEASRFASASRILAHADAIENGADW